MFYDETIFLPKKRASQSPAFSLRHKSSKRTYNADLYFLISCFRGKEPLIPKNDKLKCPDYKHQQSGEKFCFVYHEQSEISSSTLPYFCYFLPDTQ